MKGVARTGSNGDPGNWIRAIVQEHCDAPENTLQDPTSERAWDEPVVGFSRGDDPLYQQFKDVVGPYHWTPWEVFRETFPATDVEPADLTVISWVLPQTEATKADNRRQTVYPAERWARSRIYGEAFNRSLREHVVVVLKGKGIEAVAPLLSPKWESKRSDRYVFSSTWSERHAAYAAGLGTFGLCDGLITPKGKAMRLGSVVARIQVVPTARPYTDHQSYCLFYADGTCGECMERCPVGAITEAGHDKVICRAHLSNTADYVREVYGFKGYGCGLCQTGVPCESKVPM